MADLPAINIIVKAGEVISEREVSSFGIGLPAGDGGSVSALVEDGAQIAGRIENDAGETLWQPPSESDLMQLLSGSRLIINHVGPWFFVDESVNLRFEVADVMLCATQRQSRTMEDISHGQDARPDEGPGISEGGPSLPDYPPQPHKPLGKRKAKKPLKRGASAKPKAA